MSIDNVETQRSVATEQPMSSNSEQAEKDFNEYEEGEIYEPLGVSIFFLLYKGPGFIIFISETFIVCYDFDERIYNENGSLLDDYGSLTNQISILEMVDRAYMSDDQNLAFARLLAEGISRALLDSDSRGAQDAIRLAEEYIKKRSQEAARNWYVVASGTCTAIACLIGLVPLAIRAYSSNSSLYPVFEGAVAVVGGSLGAFLSILQRIGGSALDRSSGKWMYQLEAGCRICIGMISALIAALAFQLNLILTSLRQSDDMHFPAVVLLGIVAGFSERLVPSILRLVEGNSETSNDTGRAPNEQPARNPIAGSAQQTSSSSQSTAPVTGSGTNSSAS